MAEAVRQSKLGKASESFRNLPVIRSLLRPSQDVLPVYHAQRSGWAVAARNSALLTIVVLVAIVYGGLVAILPPPMLLGLAAPLSILAMLVVWALPNARRAPVQTLSRMFMVFLFCLILWPKYIVIAMPGFPAFSVRRLVGAIVFGVLLVCLSTSRSFREEMIRALRASPWISFLLIAYFVIQFFSCIFSVAPGAAIGRWVNYALTSTPICFAAVWLFGPGGKTVENFSNRLLIILLVLMVIGVIESRVQHILWLNYLGFLHLDADAMEGLAPHVRKWYRVVTTYTSSLAYGEFLALATPFVLFQILNEKNWKRGVALVAFDAFILYSAILSTARLAVIGYLVAHAAAGLLWSVHRWRKARGDLTGISLTMLYPALLLVTVLAVAFVPAVHVRVLGGGDAQSSTEARSEQFHMAVPVIAKRPVFGYGLGEGGGAINWRTINGFLSIDLGFVALAADIGLFGLVAYVGVIVLSIAALIRAGLDAPPFTFSADFAVAISLLVLITTRLVLAQTDNDAFFTMLFGIALGRLWLAQQRAFSR